MISIPHTSSLCLHRGIIESCIVRPSAWPIAVSAMDGTWRKYDLANHNNEIVIGYPYSSTSGYSTTLAWCPPVNLPPQQLAWALPTGSPVLSRSRFRSQQKNKKKKTERRPSRDRLSQPARSSAIRKASLSISVKARELANRQLTSRLFSQTTFSWLFPGLVQSFFIRGSLPLQLDSSSSAIGAVNFTSS